MGRIMALFSRLSARSINRGIEMETANIIGLVLEVLSLIGGSAVLSAALPAKAKTAIPVVGKVIELLAANVLNAKNIEK